MEKFGENIKNLLHIVNPVNEYIIENVIRGLSFYLTQTNEDYHYNETYLNDNVSDYIAFIRELQQREKIVMELFETINTIRDIDVNSLQIKIEIDGIWCIKKNKTGWTKDYIENGSLSLIKDSKKEKDPQVHITYILSSRNSISVINRYEEYSINTNIIDEVIRKIKIFCQIINGYGDSKDENEKRDYAEQII